MNSIQALADATGASAMATPESPEQSRRHTMQNHPGSISPTSAPITASSQDDDHTVRQPLPSTPSSSNQLFHHSSFSPTRQETSSSISTQATQATLGSAEINSTSYSADTSPSLHQSIFSVKDGSDVSNNRRASRRRTGPLSQVSRERAALIRKLGACGDCRRRRVACHPSHHNMTWEDVVSKFQRSHSPTMQDLAPAMNAGRPISPPTPHSDTQPFYTHDSHEMDVDPTSAPAQHASGRLPLSDARLRTPLPSGPRLEKSLSLPGIETLRHELQASSSKIISISNRGRYHDARVLFLVWQGDDELPMVENATRELADVFERYRYSFQVQTIPSSEVGASKSTWRWLSLTLDGFLEHNDQRDVLKIVYYAGHSFLDGNREMCLASSRDTSRATLLRWSPIQHRLEHTSADTLLIMDAAFYPCNRLVRQQGVFEIFAAALSEDHYNSLGRLTFTRLLAEQLRIRAARGNPLSVAELHSILLTSYPKVVHERHPETEIITSYPCPMHMLVSGNSRLPSIFLSPIQHSSPLRGSFTFENIPQMHLTIKLSEEGLDLDSWNEWLRLIPDGVKDIKVDGPYRASFS